MRSIRFSLAVFFISLLGISFGAASVLAYRIAWKNSDDRRIAREELEESRLKDRYREETNRLDDALLFQAQTLARLVQFQTDWGKLRYLELQALGLLSAPFSPHGAASIPLWAIQSSRTFSFEIYRRAVPLIRFNQEDLLERLDGQVAEFFQVETAWGASYLSQSLGKNKMLAELPKIPTDEVLHWDFEDYELENGKQVRRVILKASQFLIGAPQRNRNNPPFGGAQRPGDQNPPRNNPRPPTGGQPNTPPFFRPAITIQCAYDLSRREAQFEQFAKESEVEIGNFQSEIAGSLRDFRNRLFLMNLGVFAVGVVVSPWIVGAGLSPLRNLTAAVSKVNEKDFHLDINQSRLPKEIQPIAARLEQTLGQLKKAFAREKQATADISHELRTPLAAMLATFDLGLRKNRSVEEYRELLKECRQSCKQLHQEVERLLTLARLDAGADPLRLCSFDLSTLVHECAQLIQPLADQNGYRLVCDLKPDVALHSDPDKIREVILNFLHNAIHYNRPQGSITLSMRTAEGKAVVGVSDTGIGISEQEKGLIFERFYRVDPSRHAAEGGHSGLGLAIVKGYAELLQATLEVDSIPNEGSTFRLILNGPIELEQQAQVPASVA
ncbi:MAG: HAMP domain-containing histidine kinase [Gemmataceae bacterium]|nr:HAMP domain-containing histidine kinase [Gemmataceae bacterium]